MKNQPNTKHLKQPVLMEHMTCKNQLNLKHLKQPVLKKHITWKRSNIWDEDWIVKLQWSPIPSRPPGWYDCISDTWYFFCRKSLFTTKHKILKRQKKGNIWKREVFSLVENIVWHKIQYINKRKKKMEETSRFECIVAHWYQQSFWRFYEVEKE